MPDYIVRGSDLFSLRLSNLKNDNNQYNNSHLCELKLYLFFVRSAKIFIFFMCWRILVISLCVPWDEKVENCCSREFTLKCICRWRFPIYMRCRVKQSGSLSSRPLILWDSVDTGVNLINKKTPPAWVIYWHFEKMALVMTKKDMSIC